MKVKMILPALTEAKSPFFRPIKYSLFPPLGLATLAGYLDEHVETLDLSDEPDLVVIQVYITSAYRAYELADHYRNKGAHIALGGLHVTSLPDEAAAHADTVFTGPGEDTWPKFLADYRAGRPGKRYDSTVRTLAGLPKIRRDLIKRNLYLVPNSIVVSRGCPHRCDFCYKHAFFTGGKGYYTQAVDDALAEIDRLPGRHVYFLDDHLHSLGVMVNGSFVFGMDADDEGDFDRTVDWATGHGVETATFHILTPYPGTELYARMKNAGRLVHSDWDLYDTRHVAYSGGWKKLEPMWDWVIRAKRVSNLVPVLENVLAGFGKHPSQKIPGPPSTGNSPAAEELSSDPPIFHPLPKKQ